MPFFLSWILIQRISNSPLPPVAGRLLLSAPRFRLYEFNKLPMGISIGIQGLTGVIDELFAEENGTFSFNYFDDLVVCSASMQEHAVHLRAVLNKLQ
jgi:hypothetical protein